MKNPILALLLLAVTALSCQTVALAHASAPPVPSAVLGQPSADLSTPSAPSAVNPTAPLDKAFAFIITGFLCLGVVTENARRTVDANLSTAKALPAAAATANGTALDLNSLSAGRIPYVELALTVPAVPALVDAKTIIYTFQDSAATVTFAAIAALPIVTSLGAGGAGAAAVDRRFKLPIGVQRYVRVSAAVLAAGGDNTAVSFTLALVF